MSPPPPATYLAPLVDALKGRPTSVALTGKSRELLTQVAVGLAKRLDSDFQWFDVRDRRSGEPAWQRVLEEGISSPRFRTIDVAEMQLDSAGAETATSERRYEPPVASSSGLWDDLARIPESIRRAALDRTPDATPRVILLTNAERASASFDAAPGALRPYIESLNSVGVTVVVTARSRPRENRHDFDLWLRVEGSRDEEDRPGMVVCEGVRVSGLFPAIPPGSSYSAESFVRG